MASSKAEDGMMVELGAFSLHFCQIGLAKSEILTPCQFFFQKLPIEDTQQKRTGTKWRAIRVPKDRPWLLSWAKWSKSLKRVISHHNIKGLLRQTELDQTRLLGGNRPYVSISWLQTSGFWSMSASFLPEHVMPFRTYKLFLPYLFSPDISKQYKTSFW